MPSGTGAAILATLPDVPYVIDPTTFFAGTEGQWKPLNAGLAAPGGGNSGSVALPQSGVLSTMKVTFVGSLVISASSAVGASARWPYGLMSRFQMGAGIGNNPWDIDGLLLNALNAADHPFVQNEVDQFPGQVGGGGSQFTAGTYPISLTWEIPVAVDQVSLIASMFLQSSSNQVTVTVTQETNANLFTGTLADVTSFTGTFYFSLRLWKIPVNSKGELVLPDISHVHVFSKVPQPLLGTGLQPAPVLRTAGVLQRLFLRLQLSPTSFLSALPSAPSSALIDRISLNYGLTETPLDFNPASVLAQLNQTWYGSVLPYDQYVWDTLRENPNRDAIILQGVTNLQAQVYPDAGVTVPAGAQTVLGEEILV